MLVARRMFLYFQCGKVVHLCNANFLSFLFFARLGPIDLDPGSFSTQELKKALAKMKESVKADEMLEQKVFI